MLNEPGLSNRRLAPSFLPVAAVLEMTYRCNHRCTFCSCPWFAPDGGYDVRPEMSVDEWKSAISALCAHGVWQLAFTGGEALLKQGLEEIVAHAAGCDCEQVRSEDGKLLVERRRPELSLLTNGRAMTDGILAMCRRFDIRLSISLPGISTFTEHTGVNGGPRGVLSWMQRAKAMGLRVVAGITVTRRNLHELYETIAEALLAGADTVLLNRFLPGGRGLAHTRELLLDEDGVREMLDVAEEVLATANRYGSVGTELPLCVLRGRQYRNLSVASRCAAAKSFFAVDPSGYIRVCNHSPVRLERIDDVDLLRANPYWGRFAQGEYKPSRCVGCAIRGCDGGCRESAHILTGSISGHDTLMASWEGAD